MHHYCFAVSIFSELNDAGSTCEQDDERCERGTGQERDDRCGSEQPDAHGDEGPRAGLKKSKQSRRAACIFRKRRKTKRRGIWVRAADAGEKDKEKKQRRR